MTKTDIAKIAVLVSIFAVFVVGVISAPDANSTTDDDVGIYTEYCESLNHKMINGCAYDFVNCPGDTNTYPEGTNCEQEAAEQRDEKEHEEESEEWNDKDDEEEEEAMNKD